jgi:hypothetical protein
MGSLRPARNRHIPLFWRLFLPNALVLAAACAVLIIAPANGRILALGGGLATMLVINLALMRRAFAPLERLAALMRRAKGLLEERAAPPCAYRYAPRPGLGPIVDSVAQLFARRKPKVIELIFAGADEDRASARS